MSDAATTGDGVSAWFRDGWRGWNRFWFTPRDPTVLCLLRIAVGLMLFYSHAIFASDLTAFLGDSAWIDNDTARSLHDGTFGPSDWGRSYLWWVERPLWLWLHHALTLGVTLAFAIGLLTRVTAPLALFLQTMYLHRLTGTLFGLDQIVTYMTLYLAIEPSGSRFSVDAWIRSRWPGRAAHSRWFDTLFPDPRPTVSANIATRLLQIHLCVIYLFGGLAKARGQMWWDGTAVWFAVGNYEYQSFDMTWLSRYPLIFSLLTHTTLFWEIFYCALVWPRWSRPVVLAIAIGVHGGIALFLGMMTFGSMMIAANMIFVEPDWLRRVASKLRSLRIRQN